jgi:hypothetical protein
MPQGRFHSDKSGNRFNMLTLVMQLNEKTANGSYKYIVQCDCGESKVVAYSAMARGNTKSCGCQQYPKGQLSANWKHGLSKTKEYDLNLHMKRNYGISMDDYNAMLEAQDGKCAICSCSPPNHHKKRLNIDHCHSTGKVRGLLCDACNRAIGLLKDSPELMANAIKYIQQYSLAR